VNLMELRDRCRVDPVTRCWHWTGAMATDRTPRIWVFDPARGRTRSVSGARATWLLAHGEAPPPGWMVYRCCGVSDCLCPAHLRLVESKAKLGRIVAQSGRWKGQHVEQRAANARIAYESRGIVATPPAIVRAIRQAPAEVTGKALSERYGLSAQTVSKIRRGLGRRDVE